MVSIDEGLTDTDNDDDFYLPCNPRTNLMMAQEHVLAEESNVTNQLELFKERCLCNLHYLALIGLTNSNYNMEEVIHLAIYLHETGMITYSELLSNTTDLNLDDNIPQLKEYGDFTGDVMTYDRMIRKYLSEFISENPAESLNYLKFLSHNRDLMFDTTLSLFIDFDLIPQFFDYTPQSTQKLTMLKKLFENDNDFTKSLFNEFVNSLAEKNSGLEVSTIRILEELGRNEEILDIIMIRESNNITRYREQIAERKNFTETTDSNFDDYLSRL